MLLRGKLLEIAVLGPLAGTGSEVGHGLEGFVVLIETVGANSGKMIALSADGFNGLRIASASLETENFKVRIQQKYVPWKLG